MKKALTKILTVAMAAVMGLSIFGGCDGSIGTDLSGYVAVDINPSIEFITDKDGKVTEVRAVNDDARVLLVDMELVGLDISVAIENVTKEAEDCGFINSTNVDVSITVGGNSEKAEQKLKDIAEKAVKKGSELAVIAADEIRNAINEKVEELKAAKPELYQDLTAAKLKVINSIMEYDRSFTIEEGAKMSMEELVDLLEDYIDEFKDFINDEIKIQFEEKLNELAASVYAQIDQLVGDAVYQAKAALLRKLEILEEKFEHELESNRIEVEGEIHFRFERDFDRDDDDEDEVLTANMKTELKAALQVVISDETVLNATLDAIVTMDDLDDYIDDLEDEIETAAETAYAELSEAVKTQIENLKATIETIKAQALDFVSTTMQTIKANLTIEKAQLKFKNLI